MSVTMDAVDWLCGGIGRAVLNTDDVGRHGFLTPRWNTTPLGMWWEGDDDFGTFVFESLDTTRYASIAALVRDAESASLTVWEGADPGFTVRISPVGWYIVDEQGEMHDPFGEGAA